MSDVPYCPFYCEENAWYALDRWRTDGVDEAIALVITSDAGACPMWHQRAGPPPDGFVVWDYHVVAAARIAGLWTIHDPDCTRGCPLAARAWLRATFSGLAVLSACHRPWFRVIGARDYLEHLASDRRHMLDARGHSRQPPPPWPPIVGCRATGPHNLERLRARDDAFLGPWLDVDALVARLA